MQKLQMYLLTQISFHSTGRTYDARVQFVFSVAGRKVLYAILGAVVDIQS
jgi:hypothetical protein